MQLCRATRSLIQTQQSCSAKRLACLFVRQVQISRHLSSDQPYYAHNTMLLGSLVFVGDNILQGAQHIFQCPYIRMGSYMGCCWLLCRCCTTPSSSTRPAPSSPILASCTMRAKSMRPALRTASQVGAPPAIGIEIQRRLYATPLCYCLLFRPLAVPQDLAPTCGLCWFCIGVLVLHLGLNALLLTPFQRTLDPSHPWPHLPSTRP